MQINTVHFSSLKSLGIDEQRLRRDSCANVFSGTWILKQKIEQYGYTWDGIGSYHSRTAAQREKYVRNIVSLIAHKTATLGQKLRFLPRPASQRSSHAGKVKQ